MSALFQLLPSTRKLLLPLLLAGTSALHAQTPASLHLAYGDSRSTALPDATHKLVVRDHHEDHYHNFTANNGTDPQGHTPMPFLLQPGLTTASLSFAAMDFSPDPGETFKFISTSRANGPLDTMQLELQVVSVSDAAFKIGIFEWHDDHFHNEGFLGAGDSFALEYDGWYELRFTLDSGATLADFEAVFQLVDLQPGASPGLTSYLASNTFAIHAEAIPEPSTVGLLAGAAGWLLVRRVRRTRVVG